MLGFMEQTFKGIDGFSKVTVVKLVAWDFCNPVDQLLYASDAQPAVDIITCLRDTAQPLCLTDRSYSNVVSRLVTWKNNMANG
jgi:hypothetical protein